jgi:hypothetical protein
MHLLRGKSKKEGEEDAGNSETVPGVPADPEPETPCKEGDQ